MMIVISCPAFGSPLNSSVVEQDQVTFTLPKPNPVNQVLFLSKPEQIAGMRDYLSHGIL